MNATNRTSFLPNRIGKQGIKYLWGTIPLPFRFGKHFRRTASFLQDSQWWSRKEFSEYQKTRLSAVLRSAYDGVPYYRDLFDRLSLNPAYLRGPEILPEIPFLSREIVFQNPDRMLDQRISRRKIIEITTGGTSGRQLKIYTRPEFRMIENAYVYDLWSRVGFGYKSKRAVLRGDVIKTSTYPRTWKYDPVRKRLLLSTYDLTEENLFLFIEKIHKYRPAFIHAYPSAILALARFIHKNDLILPPLKAVLTSSENTYPGQRTFVERILNTRYFDLYGQTEQVAMAGECERSGYYHLYPQYGYTEIIGPDGKEVFEDGGVGEIVATGFINTAMPLIRYRTGDWAKIKIGRCPCGRDFPLLEWITGRRNQEMLVGKWGNTISMAALNAHSSIYERVRSYQFYQDTPGEVILTVVRDRGYSVRDTDSIRRELTSKLSSSIRLSIRFAGEISRTERGKLPLLIQKITDNEIAGQSRLSE